jgi:hypothetical protein
MRITYKRYNIIKGERFGKLTFIEAIVINGREHGKCSCDCGEVAPND